jgi:hypothetical protein
MLDNPAIHSNTVERVCRELSVPAPAPYDAALADADRLTRKLGAVGGSDTAQRLTAAVFAALVADTDPLADDEVRRLVTLQMLQNNGIHEAAEKHRRQLIGEAVTDNAELFVESWATALADDGRILADTAKLATFADVDRLDAMHPSQLVDPDDHRAWIAGSRAARRLNSAAAGVTALLVASHLRYPAEHRVLVLAPDLGLSELAAVNRDLGGQKVDAWTLARNSITPKLVGSLGEFMAAVSRISAEQARRQAEADAQAQPTFGGGVGMTSDDLNRLAAVRLTR